MTIYTHKIHRRGVFYEKGNRENEALGACHCSADDNCVQKSLFADKRCVARHIFRCCKRQYVGADQGWSLVEAIGKRSGFHRFAVSRIISLWFVGIFCLASYLLIYALGVESAGLPRFICAIAVCFSAFALSARLEYGERKIEQLFLPCVFMMLLLIAVYCSFTVFPPHMILFEDIQTGMYGIIPEYIDSGAIALDTLYRV